MGRTTWFDVVDGLKKGEWSTDEDKKLAAYINDRGICDWRSLPKRAGLQRCGKSCRLRWLNYLRPGIKRGRFTPQEEEDIIKFHAVLGNRWAAIARQMENRTDNDIKNHWNSCLKKRLRRNGIDPKTHEPITVKTTNDEAMITTYRPTESSCSSSPSGSAGLLNKLATCISSTHHNLDRIKNILCDSNIRRSDQNEEDERESTMDQNIGDGKEEYFPMWDDEDIMRYMEFDVMLYESF